MRIINTKNGAEYISGTMRKEEYERSDTYLFSERPVRMAYVDYVTNERFYAECGWGEAVEKIEVDSSCPDESMKHLISLFEEQEKNGRTPTSFITITTQNKNLSVNYPIDIHNALKLLNIRADKF